MALPATSARPWLWPLLKTLFVCLLVTAVGWHFAGVLGRSELWQRPWNLHLERLVVATGLYLLGLGFSAFYWYWLLRALGQHADLLPSLCAFYVGQLGRYIPGKVVGLGMRARLLSGPHVRLGVAVLTVVYESLTTIASGVLLGLVLLAVTASDDSALGWRTLALLLGGGSLLLPGVFNWLADRSARPFQSGQHRRLPQLRAGMLLFGLAITALGWLSQGGTLGVLLGELAPQAGPFTVSRWARCTAYVALAYAGGFFVLFAPGGLGVRDLILQQFVTAELSPVLGTAQAAETAVLCAVLIRLLWTIADVAAAGACYGLPMWKMPAARGRAG